MSEMIEIRARALAAKKINSADRYGSRLPDDIWKQAIPEAVYAYRIEVMQKLRHDFLGAAKQGYPVQDWQLQMWARSIDEFKEYETPTDRELRIRHSYASELNAEELDILETLYPGAKQRETDRLERVAREEACPGHEFESTAPAGIDPHRGWHPGRCKHCGKDMSVDSGD